MKFQVLFEQVLADIELAQSIQKDKDDDSQKKKAEQAKPHPYDTNYSLLKCSLEHLDVNSDEFKVIKHFYLRNFFFQKIFLKGY